MEKNETIYDKEIAPRLLEIGEICKANGIPFMAVAEWSPGEIGRTDMRTNDECLEMTMIRHCAKTAPNIDGYIIGLSRYANENCISLDGSIVMNRLSVSL